MRAFTSLARPLCLVACAAALTACATVRPTGAVVDPPTALDQFKVTPVPDEAVIRLAVHAHGLSPAQSAALTGFAFAWRDGAGPMIRIETPSNGPDPAASYRMGEAARAFLVGQGVHPAKIELAAYDAQGAADAALVLRYPRYRVDLPRCGESWNNLSHSINNNVSANFGCASAANLAAQLADPADLLGPRAMDPGDPLRRIEMLNRYRTGEETGSVEAEEDTGAVAQVVK